METKNYYSFRKIEVTGETKQEAYDKAPFTIARDVTPSFEAWKKSQTNGVTERDIKAWMLAKLDEVTKSAAGSGLSITVQSAIKNTNKRPYTCENVVNKSGKRQWKTFYQWVDDETGQVVKTFDKTKADAFAKMKEAVASGEYKGSYSLVPNKQVVKGEGVLGRIKYTPSKASRVGTYILFGIENA